MSMTPFFYYRVLVIVGLFISLCYQYTSTFLMGYCDSLYREPTIIYVTMDNTISHAYILKM